MTEEYEVSFDVDDFMSKHGGEKITLAKNENKTGDFIFPQNHGNGNPIKGSMLNIISGLSHLGYSVKYNPARDDYVIFNSYTPNRYWFSGDFEDFMMAQFEHKFGWLPNDRLLSKSIKSMCRDKNGDFIEFNEIKETVMVKEEWDGVDRSLIQYIELKDYENVDLYRKAVQSWARGAIARAFEPGIVFDLMLHLCSQKHGTGKTSFFREFAGKSTFTGESMYSSIESLSISAKDLKYKTMNVWIIMVAEEFASHRMKDISLLKEAVTRPEDTFDVKYGKTKKFKATHVFGGTSNTSKVLYDATGSRRHIVVEVKEIDWRGIRRDWTQIMAQLINELFVDGEIDESKIRLNQSDQDELEKLNEDYQDKHEWEYAIEDKFLEEIGKKGIDESSPVWTTEKLVQNFIKGREDRSMNLNNYDRNIIRNGLTYLGFEGPTRLRVEGEKYSAQYVFVKNWQKGRGRHVECKCTKRNKVEWF